MKARSLLPSWPRTLARAVRSRTTRQDLLWEFRRRWKGEPALPSAPIHKVMVLCQGNICRSPFAGRQLAANCPHLEVRSAGLNTKGGEPAHPNALRIGGEFGVDLSDHTTHPINANDVDWADLIVGMQGWHHATICRRYPGAHAKVVLLGDFLPAAPRMIKDPWGRRDAFFRSVFEQISLANKRISLLLSHETIVPGLPHQDGE